jgi:Flp pilus assembly protein TadG
MNQEVAQSRMRHRVFRNKATGQNLVEMALTFPLLLIVIFAIMEIGRVWNTFEGARMAAMDGAYTAAVYRSEDLGRQQMEERLTRAGIPFTVVNVASTNSGQAYQADVTVQYRPLLGGISIASLSGPLTLIPAQFDINYNNVQSAVVY